MTLSKSQIALYLALIGAISISLKLYLVDFTLPVINDDQFFALSAISYVNDEFALIAKKNPGWPLFVSFFYRLFESDNFLDYSNAIRMISIGTTTIAIIPMYLLSRKFFNEKYSLVGASLLAFEPHINFRAGFGFSEALFIPVAIMTIFFILNKNNKLVYLSFVFGGLLWWIRVEGIAIFFVISIIFFVINKKSPIMIPKYLVCLAIFALLVSPMLIQRYEQFGDPFYFYYNDRLFVEDYLVTGIQESGKTASSYIDEKGPLQFIHRFVITGTYKIIEQTALITAPYLMFLLPFGALFSLRPFDQDRSFIKANWLVILVYAGLMIIPFAVISERRFLFILYPFLIVFSVIAIQRVVEYGLSTFSFSPRSKNIFLVIALSFFLLLSSVFMLRYDVIDSFEEQEKIKFANFLDTEFDGIMLESPNKRVFQHGYLYYAKLDNPPENFKNFRIIDDPIRQSGIRILPVQGESMQEIIINAKNQNANYLLIDDNNKLTSLDDLYQNEDKYQELKKIFDTSESGYDRLKFKIFEIDKN